MPQATTPQEVAREWFEQLWNQGDKSAIHRFLAPHAVGHLEGGLVAHGPEEFEPFYDNFHALMPDLRLHIVDLIADDRRAVVRWEATGCHCGEALGFKATHREICFRGVTWLEVENGQIVNGWDSWDYGGLAAKLSGATAAT